MMWHSNYYLLFSKKDLVSQNKIIILTVWDTVIIFIRKFLISHVFSLSLFEIQSRYFQNVSCYFESHHYFEILTHYLRKFVITMTTKICFHDIGRNGLPYSSHHICVVAEVFWAPFLIFSWGSLCGLSSGEERLLVQSL